jgi:hypothetical protein
MPTHVIDVARSSALLGALLLPAGAACADDIAAARSLPIREVTSFKDGHAIVLRSGSLTPVESGALILDEIPRATMGTFWVKSDGAAPVRSVRVETLATSAPTAATSIEDLLRANVGRSIRFRIGNDETLRTATLTRLIESAPPPPDETAARWSARGAAAPASPTFTALLAEGDDVLAVPASSLQDVTFLGGAPSLTFTAPRDAERMTIALDWGTAAPAPTPISIMYLERGLRWIPSYRVTMLEGNRAHVELQGTLINELADLDGTIVHLAIGAPSFAFSHTPDPMALRESLNELGLFFRRATDGRTASMFDNAIMGQSTRMGERRTGGVEADATIEGFAASERTEDLFVFTLHGVQLPKGARMVVPITSYDVPAETLYRLDLPASPPTSSLASVDPNVLRSIAEAQARPIARTILRLTNDNDRGFPLTTAPAIVLKDGRTLAQGLMTYASPGARADLDIGAALDIAVSTREEETGRDPSGIEWQSDRFARIDIGFKATLRNHKTHAARVEVRKLALGLPTSVGQGGESTALNVYAADFVATDGVRWWENFNWPVYWHRLNGAARFTWRVDLEPGASTELDAAWHYFWR